ncbi:hypothetical protein J4447_04050 [Candidatus Pacearchaeota archaeon]|nr:hypothetical protein [Candidatus Pacearchaeota archaeon]
MDGMDGMNGRNIKVALALLSITAIIIVLASAGYASALTIKSVDYSTLTPGSQSALTIKVDNDFSRDVKDVSLSVNTAGTPFSVIGSSQDSADEINEDDDETFTFEIKASGSAKPGDYVIPYIIKYELENVTKTENGNIGITIRGNPSLEYSASIERPVINEQTRINLKIINKGFADARFVSVKLTPQGYTLLSDEEVYIGSVDSDDFETAGFDVYLNSLSPVMNAAVEYRDFDNKKIVENIQILLTVYSRERAVELGIIKESNTGIIILLIALVIILWSVWRIIKKRRARKKMMSRG